MSLITSPSLFQGSLSPRRGYIDISFVWSVHLLNPMCSLQGLPTGLHEQLVHSHARGSDVSMELGAQNEEQNETFCPHCSACSVLNSGSFLLFFRYRPIHFYMQLVLSIQRDQMQGESAGEGGVINGYCLSGEPEEPVKHIQPSAHLSLALSDTPQVIAVGCGP